MDRAAVRVVKTSVAPSRRRFLLQMAVGAGGFASVACSRSRDATPDRDTEARRGGAAPRKLGWAIVGLGKFATEQLLPSFEHCSRSRIAALVSGSSGKAQQLADRYGVPRASIYDYGTFDKLRDASNVDVVYVVLPNSMHAEYTKRAAAAGKHVMCEKPMATSVGDAREMIEACKRANRLLMVGYRARFEPHNVAAIDAARRGDIGKVTLVVSDHVRTLDPKDPADGWRMKRAMAGGGSLVDIGIYSLQAARYMTGEEPIEVTATISSAPGDARFAEVEETAAFTLRFPSGAVAACTSSYGPPSVKRIRTFGEKGYLELDPATEYANNTLRLSRERGPANVVDVPPGNQFALEIDHLSECIQDKKPLRTPGEEGLRDMRIIQAIYEAARIGRTVKLDAT